MNRAKSTGSTTLVDKRGGFAACFDRSGTDSQYA